MPMDLFQEINVLGIMSFCNIYLVPPHDGDEQLRFVIVMRWEQGYNFILSRKGLY